VAVAVVLGCNAPQPAPGTGGTDVVAGPCGRGLVVAESDYQSTNVSLVGTDSADLSSSFISSASTTTGLSAALSGDVVLPTMPMSGAGVVLLDRYPAGVVTWIEVASSAVTAQLPVNQGFAANPQDYALIGPHKAYVSRFEANPSPGKAPFDGGSDVVILDPATPALTGHIDLASAMVGEDPQILPRPNRIVVDGDRAVVLLSAYAVSFATSAASRLVVVDTATDAIVSVKVLEGLHGCSGLALAPGGGRVAVVCSGTFHGDMGSDLSQAGVVVLARSGDTLEELSRVTAEALGQGPPGFSVDFADADRILFTTFGRDAAGGAPPLDDTVIALDLKSAQHETLLHSQGTPFTLGEVRCLPECGTCFVTDAATDGGVLQRFLAGAGAIKLDSPLRVETEIGLPPRYLGRF
jgi:hypothetical protein